MKPRVTVITIGVDDLERALIFYRDGLGLTTEGIVGQEFDHGAVAFDAGIPEAPPSATEFTLGHNVGSRAEVDAVMAQAAAAGARIVKPAQDTFWGGYVGYFQDPDGHLWEVAWNPAWEVED